MHLLNRVAKKIERAWVSGRQDAVGLPARLANSFTVVGLSRVLVLLERRTVVVETGDLVLLLLRRLLVD